MTELKKVAGPANCWPGSCRLHSSCCSRAAGFLQSFLTCWRLSSVKHTKHSRASLLVMKTGMSCCSLQYVVSNRKQQPQVWTSQWVLAEAIENTQNHHAPVKKGTIAVIYRKKEIKKLRPLETEQRISFLCGTCVGSSGKRGPNLYLVRGGGMSTGQRRANSAAKEHVSLKFNNCRERNDQTSKGAFETIFLQGF